MENLLMSGTLHCQVDSGKIAITNMLRCVSDESHQQAVFLMWYPYSVFLDFTGWMLQQTHPHPRG